MKRTIILVFAYFVFLQSVEITGSVLLINFFTEYLAL